MKLSIFFRLNLIRNHFLRFGLSGLRFYFTQHFSAKKEIIFKNKEFSFPISLRNNSSDIDVFYQVLFCNCFNLNYGFEPKIIVDLGANIGLSTIYYKNKFPDCKILAVEPDKSNYDIFIENTKCYSNVFVYNNGIWHQDAFLEVRDENNEKWACRVGEVPEESENTVVAVTMNQIVKDHLIEQIDILKIDIEGSEIELFSMNYISWLSKTKLVIIELHDWMRPGCAKQFFNAISTYNYKMSHHGENIVCYLK